MNNTSSELNEYKQQGCCRIPVSIQKSENNSQHSCCKLDSFNWLQSLDHIVDNQVFDCVEVRFKNSRKDFYKIPDGLKLHWGDIVAVEASPGHDIGVVSLTGETARLQMIKKGKSPLADDVKKIYRKARTNDIEKWLHSRSFENDTMVQSRRIAGQLRLDMKINDVEYQGDGTKAIFYYTAEERVDFRILIKKLAEEFSVRIEMKQIGVRQESGRLGGIGPCGRELCCSSWMSKFKSVSTISARTQNLSLNPQKLAGQCGKLKCCLNFEQEMYAESLENFPNTRTILRTQNGDAVFRKMDILQGTMWYSYTTNPDNFIKLTKEYVSELINLNRKNIIPESLENEKSKEDEKVKYDQIVGQDDVTRFDNVGNKKRRKNRNRNHPGNRNPRQNQDRSRNFNGDNQTPNN
ncbi:MAG: hypothetical protein JXR34_00690 [Bacteroidales bacterium]|nr:hypothetical protein [Bacteroidales bacterium]